MALGERDGKERHEREATAARFVAAPSSVADARRFVGAILGARSSAPTVLLLVSELATNAIVHGEGPFEVRVVPGITQVRVEVRDGASGRPRRLPACAEATGGRGLWIVDALATAWGVESLEAGKAVWFEV